MIQAGGDCSEHDYIQMWPTNIKPSGAETGIVEDFSNHDTFLVTRQQFLGWQDGFNYQCNHGDEK